MIYPGVEVDVNCKAKICPQCQNEEIWTNGNYCKICGIGLTNFCNGSWGSDDYGKPIWLKGCGTILESNARYCPLCGKETLFNKALPAWNYKPPKNIFPNKDVLPDEEIPF